MGNRYKELRNSYFSLDYLTSLYGHYYDLMTHSGAAAREEQRWSGDNDIAELDLNFKEEYAYIIDWLDHRLQFLDLYFYGERPTSDICVPTNDVAIYHRYTISGIQANSSHKGIVIINGKKYFVK